MVHRVGLDDNETLNRLLADWADAADDLNSQLAAVLAEIEQLAALNQDTTRRRRLRILADRLENLRGAALSMVDGLMQSTEAWLGSPQLGTIYAAGGAKVAGFAYGATHQAAVDIIAQDLFTRVLRATTFVDESSKQWVRRVSRRLTLYKVTEGVPVKTQARRFVRELTDEFTARGIAGVTYRNGAVHSFADYGEMLIRTRCLPPDAPVSSARVLAASRYYHEGPWVTVETASGREFSGTPNHPMLTTVGWKGLGELAEGDKLIADRLNVETSGASGDMHVADRVPAVAEVFDAIKNSGHAERHEATRVDFHGDGPADGYVDVVRPDGMLLVGDFAPISQASRKFGLTEPDLRSIAVNAFRYRFTHGNGVGGCHCLSDAAPPHSGLIESLRYSSRCCAVLVGQFQGGCSCLIPLDNFAGWEIQRPRVSSGDEARLGGIGSRADFMSSPADGRENRRDVDAMSPGHLGAAESAQVIADEVVSLRLGQRSGHVYNLHTVDGYWWSGGLATGNTGYAYNIGTLNAGRQAGIEFYELLDGAQCGLSGHKSTPLANGLIVDLTTALDWPLSHPRCSRSVNPRPDITDRNQATSSSVQSDQAREDQTAFERLLDERTARTRPRRFRRAA